MLEIVDFLSKIAALAAAYVAFRGLYTWRRDFIGRRQLELAEDTLVTFYKARDAIASIRSPMSWVGEAGTVERDPDESDLKFRSRQTVAPTFKRSEHYDPLFSELEAMKYRYMARFGEAAAKPFDAMVRLRIRILVRARQYVAAYSMNYGDSNSEFANRQAKNRLEAESYFWHADENGPVEVEISRIMNEIERHARGVMMSAVADEEPLHRWYSVLKGFLLAYRSRNESARELSKEPPSNIDSRR